MSCISKANIISYNNESERICASAARISTTSGNSMDIFEKSTNIDKNRKLIKNVINSGHKSIIEHAVFTIAFCNVSAVVEQFFIEFRLASFTVKSRRYVDFSNMGYYTPQNLTEKIDKIYKNHVDYLFSEYNYLITQGIPKEDARFILPYCFFSNFYCTVNARELIHILQEILFGRGKNISELKNIAYQIIEQLKEEFPNVSQEVFRDFSPYSRDLQGQRQNKNVEMQNSSKIVVGSAELVQISTNALKSILAAYALTNGLNISLIDDYSSNMEEYDVILQHILHSDRPRELEQISCSFIIRNLSLSGITHIVRHRMQSIIIPSLMNVNSNRYIVPKTICDNEDLLFRYKKAFEKTSQVRKYLSEMGLNGEEQIYLCLSGNTLDVMTTMNARELMLFFRLRCCNRAQWEIRNVAKEMLKILRGKIPYLFNKMGPSCVIDDKCPEGRLTCGKMEETIQKFR